MQECSICYVTDKVYLLPSLVSAARMRSFVPSHKSDIMLFVTNLDNVEIDRLKSVAQKYSITIVSMNEKYFSGFIPGDVHKSYISLTTLGRFFINDALPQSCRKIMYIDGDTWAFKDPSRLIDWNIPDGKLAGVEDTSVFDGHIDESVVEDNRKYFQNLGLSENVAYMNAGVFYTTRDAWKEIAKDSLEFYQNNTAICRLRDQSALNAVIGDRRIHLPMTWNFQTHYKLWGIKKFVDLGIGHFTGNGKAWAGKLVPWTECYEPFHKEAGNFKELGLTFTSKSPLRCCGKNVHQLLKKCRLGCQPESRSRLFGAIKAELARCVQIQ